MNPEVCKNCNEMYCFVMDDTIKSIDRKQYIVFTFDCGNFFHSHLFSSDKLLEAYKLKNGKWKLIRRNKFWFKWNKNKLINKELRKVKPFKTCQYYIEHCLMEWNKNES